MIARDERLAAWVRQLRRLRAPGDPTPPSAQPSDSARIDALEARMVHLEQLLEGLQDSVHRSSARQEKLIGELQAQVRPEAMGAALSRDARDRGLE